MNASPQPALDAADWRLASAQRGRLYGWFSALYAEEVSDETFNVHFARGIFSPFAGLETLGLGPEVVKLQHAIESLRGIALARLELAADFAQLFLLDARTGALPYASAYGSEGTTAPLYGSAHAEMRRLLAARSLSIQPHFREPADHLAVPLALMGHFAENDAIGRDISAVAREQATFLRSVLLDWLPRFVERCRQAKPRFDFYPALADLLLGFVRADLLFLDDVAEADATPAAEAQP